MVRCQASDATGNRGSVDQHANDDNLLRTKVAILIWCWIEAENQDEHVEKACEEGQEPGEGSKHQEKLVVPLANTRTDPRTVMVVHFDTGGTIVAVKGSWWSDNMASSTARDRQLVSAHQSDPFFVP